MPEAGLPPLPSPYAIREGGPGDLPGVAHLFNRYLGTGSMALDPLSGDDFTGLLEDDRTFLLVATLPSDDRVIAYASFKPWSPRRGYRIAGEVSIFLHPDHLRRGLGDALYRLLLPESERRGYRYLAARIRATNPGSVRFHERHGFTVVGIQRGIGLIEGQRQDTVLLERVLP